MDFFNMLTGPQLLELTEAHLPAHRERLYPPTVTLSMFLGQALSEDGSCQKAVNSWAMRRAAEGLRVSSIRTGRTAERATGCRRRLSPTGIMEPGMFGVMEPPLGGGNRHPVGLRMVGF